MTPWAGTASDCMLCVLWAGRACDVGAGLEGLEGLFLPPKDLDPALELRGSVVVVVVLTGCVVGVVVTGCVVVVVVEGEGQGRGLEDEEEEEVWLDGLFS